ncbi:MAG TPA: hypothetical protein VGD11_01220 [Mycobacteriales bacterium]
MSLPTGDVLAASRAPSSAAPDRRAAVLSAAIAAVLALAVGMGAGLAPGPYLLLVGAVQAVLIAAWWVTVRPPGRTAVVAVAAVAAVTADVAVVGRGGGTVAPVLGVVALAFVAAVLAQLVRGVGRVGVTESFGSTMLLTVCCCALAAALALRERPGGPGIVALCLGATGAALVVAHLADAVRPFPELTPGTRRGGVGVALGAVAGSAAAVGTAAVVALPDGFTPLYVALVGGIVALTAILVGVGQVCAAIGREQAGEPVPASPLGLALGPLWGIVAAVVGAYVVGNVVLG